MTGFLIKRNWDTKDVSICEKDHESIDQEGCKLRREALKQICQHLDLRLLASELVRKYICQLSQQSLVFCFNSPSKLIQYSSFICWIGYSLQFATSFSFSDHTFKSRFIKINSLKSWIPLHSFYCQLSVLEKHCYF